MAETISWIATVATVVAALMTAANLGARVTGLGFALFTIGALCWITVAALTGQPALLWTNIVLTLVDIFGVWRWLGRQARVDEGARSAAKAAAGAPGEALFPISLLTRAHVECGGKEVGVCVEAMAGSRSGQLDYIVVSAGGVAGIGERLRRLPWIKTHVENEKVVADVDGGPFNRLEELRKDEWPAR